MNTADYKHAHTILHDFRSGSSQPALVEASDGKKYVVKWKCTGEGPASPATDWIALRLAEVVGIPVPQSSCIIVEDALAVTTRHGELKDLIRRSAGVNLAIEYLSDGRAFTQNDIPSINTALREKIFLFDLLLLNIDRIDSNPNMLIANNTIYCIDFSASMEIKFLLTENTVSEAALLQRIRRHPFYSDIVSMQSLNVPASIIQSIVDSVPDEWLNNIGNSPNDLRMKTIEGLATLFRNASATLERRLKILPTIPLESPEEIRERTLNNRRAFEAATGKRL